ncbi:hypothetical protein MRX96_059281 [Rhipicephalus microplus]
MPFLHRLRDATPPNFAPWRDRWLSWWKELPTAWSPTPTNRSPHSNEHVLCANGAPPSGIICPSHLKVRWHRGGDAAMLHAALAYRHGCSCCTMYTLTMKGVSHGVIVGAKANGPLCMALTEEG